MRTAWTLAGAYIGSVIGAGFSSGQELLRFFAVFGSKGLWGMAVATLLFVFSGAVILDRVYALRTLSHRELLHKLCGEYLGSLIDILLNLFVFGGLGVMLAASGALFRDLYNLPFTVGVIGMALCTRSIVKQDVTKLLDLNGWFVFTLIALTLGLLLPIAWHTPIEWTVLEQDASFGMIPKNWFVGAVLYVSFNVALSLSPLGALGDQISNRRHAVLGSLIGGIGLGAIGFLILTVVLGNLPQAAMSDLPVVWVLNTKMPHLAPIYAIALGLAILTSCVGAAYGLGSRIAPHIGHSPKSAAATIGLFAIPIAYIGFGNLVQTLYPLLGYIGLGVVVVAGIRFRYTRAAFM